MSGAVAREFPLPRFRRIDRGPCCAVCGALPSTAELEREAIETGACAELAVYAVTLDDPHGPGSVLSIGWVCAGRVHGDLGNSVDEGRRMGWYTR